MKKNQNSKTPPPEEKIIALPDLSNLGIAKITSTDELKQATINLSQLNKYLDSIVEYKEKKTKPLNEALKVIREETRPYEKEIQAKIDAIRLAMTQYQTNLVAIQKQKELAITDRVATGKLSLNTAIKKLENLPTPAKEVPTDAGLVQFREKKQLKVINTIAIPDEYFILDEKKLLEDLIAGKQILGAEIEIIQVPVNYR